MPGLTRAERWLLATASLVLAGGMVSVALRYDDSGPFVSTPAPRPTVTPSPSPAPLRVSQLRITTYSRGSHQLVVRARVSTGGSAAVLVADRRFALHLLDGEVTGTVPVVCGAPVPVLVLVVRTADGATVTTSLGRPAGPFADACAARRPGAPLPTSSPRGS